MSMWRYDVTNVTLTSFLELCIWRFIATLIFWLFPGKPRVTKTEKDFANFSIFDDPDKPYSSFTFSYDHQTFDRLHELMKFNTLLNVDLIKEKIAYQVLFRRNNKKMPLHWMFLYQDNINEFFTGRRILINIDLTWLDHDIYQR